MFTRRRAAALLILISVVSVVMAAGIGRLKTSVEFEKFLPEEYPSIKALYEIRGRFPQSSTIFFVVSNENMATPEGVLFLRSLENSMLSDPECSPWILQVRSFASHVLPPNSPPPAEPVIRLIIDNLLANENTRGEIVGRLLSSDLRSALLTVSIRPVRSADRERVIRSFGRWSGGNDNFRVSMTGDVVMYSEMDRLMSTDNRVLIPAAAAFVLTVLFLVFRRPSDILIALLVVALASLWTVGLMGFLGIEFTTLHVALIPLLLGLGVDYALYFLNRYYEERGKGRDPLEASNATVRTTGRAVVVAAVTTIVGFASFGVSWLTPVRNLGFFAALGIGCAFALALTFAPSVLILRDWGRKHDGRMRGAGAGSGVAKASLVAERHWKLVMLVAITVAIPSAVSALNLPTSMSFETFLPSGLESVQTFSTIEKEFGGQSSIIVVCRENTLTVRGLADTLALENSVLSDPRNSGLITHGWSIANLVMMAGGGRLPSSDAEVAALVSSMDPQTRASLLSSDNVALIHFFVNTRSEQEMRRATEIVRDHVENYQGVLNLRVNGDPAVTGFPVILSDIMGSLWGSMMRSTLLTIVLCFMTLIVLFRSPLLGTGAMLPLLLALSWEFGTMRLLGWSLDVLTIGISALVIGLGIDYAVHITHRYLEERVRDPENALAESLSKIAPPIMIGFSTTAGVFAILSLSRMPAMARFGQLTALVVTYALLVALFVLPAFLVAYGRWRKAFLKREKSTS